MPARIQQLLNRALEWWNKFTAKQKTIIIVAAASLIMTIGIIVTLLNQTQYVVLLNSTSTAESATVKELLDAQGIPNQVSDDGLQVKVDKDMKSDANMLLGANNIQSIDYSIDNVTAGGFSDTEADKQRRYKVYMESQLAKDFSSMEAIKSAIVQLNLPENDGTLISKEEEASAFIILELEGEFTGDNATALAKGISVALGSKSPQNIEIIDTQGNTLFSGDDTYSITGNANSQLSVKSKAEAVVGNEVRKVLLGTNEFNKIEVASNLALDFSSSQSTFHGYAAPAGRDEGMLAHRDSYSADSANSGGGVPGTDSNTADTTYQYLDNAGSSSSETELSEDFLPDETVTTQDIPPGVIDYTASSIAVTATSYEIVREEDIRASGGLAGVTWEQYKLNNAAKTPVTATPEMLDIVSKASGIPVANIAIMGFSENVFYDAENTVPWTDIGIIVLIVAMLAMMAFLVIRSMRAGREVVQEEELSVETLLQSQPSMELEDINLEDGSESKKLIDRFVEENPEAAAALLRNWLNEDWA